jgi:hypothetical protein
MVSQCANSECGKPLRHLDSGRVIRTVKRVASSIEIQHFWLCGECYVLYDFSVSAAGDVSYLRREKSQVAQREYYSRPQFAL